jgi:hypothetical protein
MAEINFYIQYFIKAQGREWADLPEEFTESLLQECSANLKLVFNDSKFEPSLVDLSEVDTWSKIPKEFKKQGFDAFASIYVVFDVEDELLEDLALDNESEEYEEDIGDILGKNVYQVEAQLPISRPTSLQILL